METTYIKGDKGQFTGETQMIHGGLFFNVLMVEGRNAGKVLVTQRGPGGGDPHANFRREQNAVMKADFAKLHN